MTTLQSYPSITREEYSQACRFLEERSYDRLEGTDWRRVEWNGDELRIRKAITAHQSDENRQTKSEIGEVDESDLEEVEDDQNVLRRAPYSEQDTILVDFSILLSPTYQVPVLWFCIVQAPPDQVQNLETVYRYLVPQESQTVLRELGVMGGISIAHHPTSDHPAFFMHPCNTPDALRALKPEGNLTPDRYLYLWLGLIGPSVGLCETQQDPGSSRLGFRDEVCGGCLRGTE